MALKGTLKDFSVADIFQLIGQQSKSGSLMVRTGEREAQVVFDKGKVILGTFRRSDEEFLLGTMLLRAGVISADQLSEAMNQQKTSLRSLGDVLRSMGAITPKILGEFVALQLKEVLFRLFQWKEGLYEFVPGEIKYNRNIIVPQSAEGILMDGFRMLDEWPAIMAKLETLDHAYRAKVDPDRIVTATNEDSLDSSFDDAFSGFGESNDSKKSEIPHAASITDTEKTVLTLLDGHHSVQEVIYLSRLGTFETARIVAGLLSSDLIEMVDQMSQTMVASSTLMKKKLGLGRWLLAHLRPMLATFFISLVFPLLVFNPASYLEHFYTDSDKRSIYEQRLNIQDLTWLLEQKKLANALSLYKFNHSNYPFALEDLGFTLLSPHWTYNRLDHRYTLRLEAK